MELLKKSLDLVREEFRPQAALSSVALVASHHRIQCSPGFRDAAVELQESLRSSGVEVEILKYPAKTGVSWWSQDSFPEWSCKEAELVLLEDGKRQRLACFAEQKISLVQRSAPTPPDGIHTQMIYIEKGTDPAAYQGIDVTGKIVFTRGMVTEVAAIAVDQFGAAGIAVDNMAETPGIRDRFTLADGRQYQSFWPAKPENHKAFGFMLTPRQGEVLRRKFAQGKTELQVFAKVDSSFDDGTMEVLQATIPGETSEEVAAIAHLCHPEPSANDNASGCGALAEGVRTLQRLISSGRLPKPRRTIRFLWVAEMTGSYAYLANREPDLSRFVAAVNLDMVGQNQDLCKSTFNVERPVAALPGFGGDLAETILRHMAREVSNLGRTHSYATFRWAVGPYSGGSDHYVWGDPTVGVTCPMLIQWPDVFYHTSDDTIDKVDPNMLAVAGVLATTYLYVAASATPETVMSLAGEMATRFVDEVENSIALIMDKWSPKLAAASDGDKAEVLAQVRRAIERRISFLGDRKILDLGSVTRLAGDFPGLDDAVAKAREFVTNTEVYLTGKHLSALAGLAMLDSADDLPLPWEDPDTEAAARASEIIPVRCFRGPFSGLGRKSNPAYDEANKAFRQRYKGMFPPTTLLQYWADGERNLLEIAHLVEGESGFWNLPALLEVYDIAVLGGIFQGS